MCFCGFVTSYDQVKLPDLHHPKPYSVGEGVLKGLHSSFGRVHVFNDWFSVQVGGPVDQVKAPEQHGEHDAGDAVDLTHAVERFLVLLGLRVRRGLVGLAEGTLGDGGQRGVFRDVGSVVSHSYSVRVVFLHDGRFLFLQGKWLGVRRSKY